MIAIDAESTCAVERRTRARSVWQALIAHYGGDPGQESAGLFERLFVAAEDGPGWLFGVSEFSVSSARGRRPRIRALAEVPARRTPTEALKQAAREWGCRMLRATSASPAESLFSEVYEAVYLRHGEDPAVPFRFGMSLELGGPLPVIKTYFDLHATTLLDRGIARRAVAQILCETPALEAWQRSCPGVPVDTGRVIGVDFSGQGDVRSKFYWGTRHLSWSDIRTALRDLGGHRHEGALTSLERELGDRGEVFSSLLISMCCAGHGRSMKLDFCIPRLFPNDGDAYRAIERLRQQLLGEAEPAPLDLFTGGMHPSETKCVQQYFGVEFPPEHDPRCTVYYRPIGFETEHLNPDLHPRRIAS